MTPDQLKASILQLAIQGELVPQRPEEGTAEELYQQIQREKKKLTASGKLKKEKPLPPISEEEIPFDIPESWEWVRLGEVCNKLTDGSHNPPPKADTGCRVISAKNIKHGEIVFEDNDRRCDEAGFEKENPRTQITCGDVILGIIGASIGKVGLYNHSEKVIAQRSIAIISTFFDNKFLKLVLESSLYQKMFVANSNGSAQAGVYLGVLAQTVFPLPPLAEQQRIVEKIEQMLPLVEQYGEAYTALESLDARFPDDMRKSILQYAIQGKLVPQRLEEGTAEDLYQQIQKEKKKLIAAGKLKKEKPLPPISEDEIPFDIPDSWKWVRLGEIVYSRGQCVPQDKFSYIDIGSIDNKACKLSETENIIEPDKAPSRARKIVGRGDILYSTVRPYLHNMCVIDKEFSCTPIASTGFAVLTCHVGLINEYLFYYMLSPTFDEYANRSDNSKGVAYPAITEKKLLNAVVPLPPQTEQRRIAESLIQSARKIS